MNTNQTYRIQIEVDSDKMRMYLDDQQLLEVATTSDDKYPGPLYSSTTVDNETGDIIVKVVNTSSNRQLSKVQVVGADYIHSEGTVIEMTADSLTVENSFEAPTNTASVTRTHTGFGTSFEYEFPSYSVTILRLKTTEGPVVEFIDEVEVITAVNQAPQLPSTVTLRLSDNTTENVNVQWKPIDQLQYKKPGVFEVEGIVAGTYLEAEATIKVLEENASEELLKAHADLQIPNADNVRGNITLPQGMIVDDEYVRISWNSSHPDVISAEDSGEQGEVPAGVVQRQASDVNVVLTASLELNGQTMQKTFNLTVKAAAQLNEYAGYIYTYFRADLYGDGESQHIHLATSSDGLFWDDMNNNEPILESTLGTKGVRDSYIVRAPEGDRFYMIATDLDANGGNWGQYANNGSKSIMVWESDDLVNWSDQRMIEIAPENAGNMWAPETIYDPSTGEYVVFWASNVSGEGHRIYYAKTRDFWTFTAAQVFKDRTVANTFIDTSMIEHDNAYYRFTKNEQNLTILLEKSDSVLGSYQLVKEKIANQDGVEGPGIFKLNGEDKWMLLMDGYAGSNAGVGFYPLIAETPADLATGNFRRLDSNEFRMPTGAKHGSIIPVTEKEYSAVIAKWGQDLVQPITPDTGLPIIPDVEYTFDEVLDGTVVTNSGKSGAQNNATLHNGASYITDEVKGNVLRLGGGNANSNSAYLEFPQGYFDGKDNVTIMMDIKSEMDNQFFFTFGVGQDNNKYLFLRTRPNEIYSALTVKSNAKEQGITETLTNSIKNNWTNLAIVLERNDDGQHSTMRLYQDGVLVGIEDQLVANMSTMGADLKAYLGKAFYPDPYFKGSFDNVRVYNRALTDEQIATALLPAVEVEGITLDQSAVTLKVGESDSLVATVTPNNATNKAVTFTSNDEAVSVSNVVYDDQTGTTSATITGVTEGSAVITALTVDGQISAEAVVTVEGEEVIPGEVSAVKVATGDQQLTLSWKDPANIKQVKLTISDGTAVIDSKYVDQGVEGYVLTGLTNGTEYKIHISTIDNEDNESVGISVTGTPETEPPVDVTPPAEVTKARVVAGDQQLTLKWTDPTDDDLASIRIKGHGNTTLEPVLVNKGVEGYTFTALTNGTEYEFLISTVDTAGNESAGIVVSGTPRKPSNPNPDPGPGQDSDPGNGTTEDPADGAEVKENGQVTVKSTVNDNGIAVVKLSAGTMKRALEQAKGNKLHITVEADTDINSLELELPMDGELIDGTSIDSIELDTGLATITVSIDWLVSAASAINAADATNATSTATANQLKLSVTKGDTSSLTAAAKEQLLAAANAELYNVKLAIDGVAVGKFDGQSDVQMALPYALKTGEQPGKVVIYHVNDNGELEAVVNGKYNAATGKVEFKPEHVGKYVVAYVDTSFKDVTQVWAQEAIEALAARGVVRGIGGEQFNPSGQVTRAEFITMLMRVMGLSDGTATTAFTDVKPDTWYYDQVATAHQLGIVRGRTDGSFGVHDEITRQDMAVMVYQAIKVKQLELAADGMGAAAEFADQADISAYAQQAVAKMLAAGIISGMGNGEFAPKEYATRAQAAVMIYNLLKPSITR